ncbi:transcriptional regulator OPI1 [Sporobolomyces koalae]|uniref:transcriptional regulator OPI1 n=1 Tax=Sporobolomyces koalae TaxID=500713 RepID=UPI0031708199
MAASPASAHEEELKPGDIEIHAQVRTSHDASTNVPEPDDSMTDDVKLAISALGLLRNEGGSQAGTGPRAPQSSRPDHPQTLASSSTTTGATAGPSHSPYRSTSTASTSTTSDAWGTNSTSLVSGSETSTGASTPMTTTSFAPSDGGDYFKRVQRDQDEEIEIEQDPNFIERVSQLPLVSGGLEWYERSKANSRVVKYGAGLVESSLSAVSRPITNNLQLGPLDDFACRQLDRIGAPHRSPSRRDAEPLRDELERENTPPSNRPEDASARRSASPGGQVTMHNAQRSRWQTVLVEAGGLGAAVSEESLKSLRYCLQWLIYASAHLDHQISTLREFILSLRALNRSHPSSASRDGSSSKAVVVASASAHLSQIKHDVVETIRKVVEVVSKYAGAALPEQAKRYVKQSIMSLPVKWANAIESKGPSGGERMERHGSESEGSGAIERMGTDHTRDRASASHSDRSQSREEQDRDAEARAALGPTEEAADRVLTFAVESLDMLKSVSSIFGESVEKAEAWIERLRIVGLQRQRQRQEQEQQQHDAPQSLLASSAYSVPRATSSASDIGTASGGMKRRRGTSYGPSEAPVDRMQEDNPANPGEEVLTDAEEVLATARRKRGPRSREMSAQLS